MISLNRAIIAGNLTDNPTLESLQNGRTSCKFNLGIKDIWKDSNGKLQVKISHISIVTFGDLAKNCNEYLKKDFAVMVEGRIEVENGTTQIVANNVAFLENK